nr:unnamed protein product [Callosobruchus chinensis]
MVYCAVVGCSNNNNKRSKNYSSNYRYFSFPTANKEVCKIWVQKCYQKHMFKIENARICSDHFSDEAFCDKEKLLQLPRNKWKLKENAIPSLNLAKAETANKNNRDERTKKRNLAKNIEDM